MKKNVNLKGIIIVLVIGFFSISVIKQVIVLKRIKSDISTQAQELEELKEKEWAIAIAVGINKINALIGALRGGFMNVLYTDEKTARELLNRCG